MGNKFFYLLNKFSFRIYFKYILYSIFYFLNSYILSLKVKKKVKKLINYTIPVLNNIEVSNLYYKTFVYTNIIQKSFKSVKLIKEDLPLYLFCSSRVNYKVLDDKSFSFLLHNVRHIFRSRGKKKNSFILLNKIVKKSIPLSKIIYQRRGRNLIPLMTFLYSSDIRDSLGLKYILKEVSKIKGLDLNSYENKL